MHREPIVVLDETKLCFHLKLQTDRQGDQTWGRRGVNNCTFTNFDNSGRFFFFCVKKVIHIIQIKKNRY